MRRARRTKILAPLGPASENPEMIAKLFEAGADVFRLNMSHLPRERLSERVEMIRAVEAKFKRPIAILADLQGPKLRVDMFEGTAPCWNRDRPSPSMPTRRPATPSACTCPIPRSSRPSSPAIRSSSTTASCGCASRA